MYVCIDFINKPLKYSICHENFTTMKFSKINDGGIVVGLNFGAGRQPLFF